MSQSTPESSGSVTREAATNAAQELLRTSLNSILGTLSASTDAAPFGSVAPYALGRTGAPLLYVASIAEHTKNFRADPRASLLVHAPVGPLEDIQTQARLCLMGTVHRLNEQSELADGWARYRARIPQATSYQRTHDFSLWQLNIERVRWIGGFGEIFWLTTEDFHHAPEQDPLYDHARGVIDHMNADHLDAINIFYQASGTPSPKHAHMVGIDQWGMDFDSDDAGRLRVNFPQVCKPDTVRKDVVDALQHARQKIGVAQ